MGNDLILAFFGGMLILVAVSFPFYGFLFVIAINQFDRFFQFEGFVSSGRIIGVAVVAGWVLQVVRSGRTRFFRSKWMNLLLLAYPAALTLSTLFADSEEQQYEALVKIGILVIMAIMLQDLIKGRRQLVQLLWTIGLSFGLSAIVGLFQYQGMKSGSEVVIGKLSGAAKNARYAGVTGNPNEYGMMLMSGLPVLFLLLEETKNPIAKSFLYILIAASVFSLVLSQSRTHFIALLFFLLIYFSLKYWYGKAKMRTGMYMVAGAILLYIVSLLVPSYVYERLIYSVPELGHGADERLAILVKSFGLVQEYPVLGVGVQNYKKFEPLLGLDAHDIISFSLGETGLMGTAILITICGLTLKRQRKLIGISMCSPDVLLRDLSLLMPAAFLSILISGLGIPFINMRMFWIYISLTIFLVTATDIAPRGAGVPAAKSPRFPNWHRHEQAG